MELKINPEYLKLIPRPSSEEYEALKESIQNDGLYVPIIINEDNVILDGHTRYEICKELGIEPKVERRTFPDKLDEEIFVIEVNLKRRHLETWQKIEMGELLEPRYAEKAKRRQEATLPKKGEKGFKPALGSIEPHIRDEGKTSEQTAKAVGTSRTTYERGREVKEKAPDLWEKVKKEELSVSSAHETLQITENIPLEKREKLEPKLEEIKTEMRKADLSVGEKRTVVEKLAEKKGKVEDIDIERTIKVTETESLTRSKSPEVQKRAIALVEEKLNSGEKVQVIDVVREAEEEIRNEELIPSSEEQIEKLFKALEKIPPPPTRKEDRQKFIQGLLLHIDNLIKTNNLCCPKCGSKELRWKCGHKLLGEN